METVQWWLSTVPFDGTVGSPAGPPEWPLPGGQYHQPGKLVAAVELLRSEWNHLPRGDVKPPAAAKASKGKG